MLYKAYDTIMKSDIELCLPEISPSLKPAIRIKLGHLDTPPDIATTWDKVDYKYYPDSIFLRWKHIGSYKVNRGKEIIISKGKDLSLTSKELRLPLLGTVLAIALNQRGTVTLHGASALINGRAVIFLGAKGEGKSTFMGYLKSLGYPIITDDICAVSQQKGKSNSIHPSYPSMKLWPDALDFLGYAEDDHERVHPMLRKRRVDLDQSFHTSTEEIDAIILIKSGPDIKLKRVAGARCVPQIIPHVIMNRFPENQPGALQKMLFSQIVGLTSIVPVYELTRPRDLCLLPTLFETINQSLV